ncbi:unnamed protein product [Linum trigynum]|uniref:Uncharacterized protein n=1 Tax=Linum trigynum TaxID=586398 RepID=A0AAV2C7L1_9ROSI
MEFMIEIHQVGSCKIGLSVHAIDFNFPFEIEELFELVSNAAMSVIFIVSVSYNLNSRSGVHLEVYLSIALVPSNFESLCCAL